MDRDLLSAGIHYTQLQIEREREREDKKRGTRERVMIEEEKAERNRMMKEGSEKGNVMFSS